MNPESTFESVPNSPVAGSPTSPRRRYPVLSVDVGDTKGVNQSPRRQFEPATAQQEVQQSPAHSAKDEVTHQQLAENIVYVSDTPLNRERNPASTRTPSRIPRQAPELPRSPSGGRWSSNKTVGRLSDDQASGSPDAERIKAVKSPERMHSMLQPKSGKAEVHIIGEIVGCTDCQQRTVLCRWHLDYDQERWHVLKGLDQGCTPMSTPELPEDRLTLWSHPIDIWMSTHSIQRWPSLVFKLYKSDDRYGYGSFCGHAVCPLPTTPGIHDISCRTWFALDSSEPASEGIWRWFSGRTPRLVDESYVVDGHGRREGHNSLLYTESAGTIHLRLQVLFKDLVDLVHVGGESLLQSLEKLHTSAEKSRRRARSTVQAMQEHSAAISEGLRSVQQGREARFQAVQHALDARRTTDQQSPPLSRNASNLSSNTRWSNRGQSTASEAPSTGVYPSPAASIGRPSPGTSRATSRRPTTGDFDPAAGAGPSTPSSSGAEGQSPSPTRRNLRDRASPISSRITSSPSASRARSRSALDQDEAQTPTRSMFESPNNQQSASGRYQEPDYGPLM